MIVNTAQVTINHTANQCAPREGPKTLAVPLDFTGGITTIELDYSMLQPNTFEQLQGMYIDNSGNGQSLTITILSTQQKIVTKANRQRYVTVLSQNPIRLKFQSTGGVEVKVHLLNFPVASAEWETA